MSIQLTTISIRLSAPSVLAVIDVACRVVLLARRHGIEVDACVQSPEVPPRSATGRILPAGFSRDGQFQ